MVIHRDAFFREGGCKVGLPGDAVPLQEVTDPYVTSALVVAALMQYESNNAACMEMLEYLNGPNALSGYEKQFLGERLRGEFYKVRSFFSGATAAAATLFP